MSTWPRSISSRYAIEPSLIPKRPAGIDPIGKETANLSSPVVTKGPSLEPPGGILVWMVVFIELLTFGVGLVAFLLAKRDSSELFRQSNAPLNQPIAFANTLILLTGGWLMVNGLVELKRDNVQLATRWISGAVVTGISFLFLKGLEYANKFEHGIGLASNELFSFYYLLTGFHLAHVIAAVSLLLFTLRGIRCDRYNARNHFDVESSAVFWHMCDLIWLLVYPIIYLL